MKQKNNFTKFLCTIALILSSIVIYGQQGNALHFDGANDYILGTHFPLPNDADTNSEFTIEAWIKLNTDSDTRRFAIVSWSNSTNDDGLRNSYAFNLYGHSLEYIEWIEDDWHPHSSSPDLNDDEWHHVAVVRKAYIDDGDDVSLENNIFFYLDGVNISQSKSGNTSNMSTDTFTIGAYKFPGGDINSSGRQHYFPGSMDELRIWSVAKTQEDIREQMLLPLEGNEDNLLAYYPFNEGEANDDNTTITEVTDESGNGFNGTLTNFTLTGDTSNFVVEEDYATTANGTFITTWETTADDESITIPINTTLSYNFTVDWGDNDITTGLTETSTEGDLSHEYDEAGTYTVTITGDFLAIYFNDATAAANAQKIKTVEQWGFMQWKSMLDAFEGCTSLDVVAGDTPNLFSVEDMRGMFRDSGFTGQKTDINSWDVSNVESFSIMFADSDFNANIGSWNLESMDSSTSENIFGGGSFTDIAASMSCLNTTSILIGWANNDNTPDDVTIQVNQYFDYADDAVDDLVGKGWSITSTTGDCSNFDSETFITTWETTVDGESITIPTNDGYDYNYNVDWGDGNVEYSLTASARHPYATAGIHTVTIFGDFPAIYFNNEDDNEDGIDNDNKDKITEVIQWGSIQWESMSIAFSGCTNLNVAATAASPDLTNVTDMDYMFHRAFSFNQNINDWDVSKVEFMNSLFNEATLFNQDLSGWDVSNVENMGHMFYRASAFNQNIGGWTVNSVEYLDNIFNGATDFNQNLGDWEIENVENISDMFTSSAMDCVSTTDTLLGWGADDANTASDLTLTFGDYATSAADAVSHLVDDKGWTIEFFEGTGEIDECPTLSINDDVFSNSITVYPNPVTNTLTINTPSGFELKEASVYTIMGKKVLSTTSTNLDAGNLASGLYVLKIENTAGQIAIKKIVKK